MHVFGRWWETLRKPRRTLGEHAKLQTDSNPRIKLGPGSCEATALPTVPNFHLKFMYRSYLKNILHIIDLAPNTEISHTCVCSTFRMGLESLLFETDVCFVLLHFYAFY